MDDLTKSVSFRSAVVASDRTQLIAAVALVFEVGVALKLGIILTLAKRKYIVLESYRLMLCLKLKVKQLPIS